MRLLFLTTAVVMACAATSPASAFKKEKIQVQDAKGNMVLVNAPENLKECGQNSRKLGFPAPKPGSPPGRCRQLFSK